MIRPDAALNLARSILGDDVTDTHAELAASLIVACVKEDEMQQEVERRVEAWATQEEVV